MKSGNSHPYVELARRAVKYYCQMKKILNPGEAVTICPNQEMWNKRRGCFVSIKNLDGSLRGCIGTIRPVREDLSSEIVYNALAAAFEDPRFMPLREEELENVKFSVDVLSELEIVDSTEKLDPKIYGVVVEKGFSKGVLLPNLDGVNTVAEQLEIAARKAGILSLDGCVIYKFTVDRYEEVLEDK
ncbi:AmmeMemoRadiSam system protein A [Acetomicrobium sp. UBA5826]|uniref:AmmeMemoRadiSam system protein A n=1 Tax=Acetomicrobium sp. UBA5826 TaxID=1946039 RepID=UPI00257F3130|nr:AmmeMemoRadiSam system protein A [Acetomicrobium sp. UBA5826]